MEARNAISVTAFRFEEKIGKIDKKLASILPEEISAKVKLTDMLDSTIYKVDKRFRENVKGISLQAELKPEERKRIAAEWQNNLELYIKDFAKKQISEMRKDLQATILAGNRWDDAVKVIQRHKAVSDRKAKFLARQETKLLVAKFTEVRYASAGVSEYNWFSVTGSKLHPVRPQHKALNDAKGPDGKKKIYRFDDPPVTSAEGESVRHNNPGEDYNCRCFARPIVRFKK